MKLRILSQDHDRAAEGSGIVYPYVSSAEYVLQKIHIYAYRIVCKEALQRLESDTGVFIFGRWNILGFEIA